MLFTRVLALKDVEAIVVMTFNHKKNGACDRGPMFPYHKE